MFKMSDTSLNIFEELQLLDSLRIQLEERQSRGMQHALFDAMFSYQEDEVNMYNTHNAVGREILDSLIFYI